ncbi:hypothetical protein J6590_041227 [Homalodisca vitripennis]|nr:hypothetical protein J6590_041227 [Homalodisca vitripennis]
MMLIETIPEHGGATESSTHNAAMNHMNENQKPLNPWITNIRKEGEPKSAFVGFQDY